MYDVDKEMQTWTARKGGVDEPNHELPPFNAAEPASEYQRDRARVIHSAAFRRLQSKTQVLGLGDSDFYRTRLTHSLEVAQIGSGLCEILKEKYKKLEHTEKANWIPPLYLIESICLAHDIGHPAFGHGGEKALNYCMLENGGFEGNGQTLRIISSLGEYSPKNGMDLTRRTALGLIKYPVSYAEVQKYNDSKSQLKNPINLDPFTPPKCYFNDESEVFKWIIEPFDENEKLEIIKFNSSKDKHGKAIHKPFDTSIMELADDIAYGVHDLEDSIALGLISRKKWDKEMRDHLKFENLDTDQISKNPDINQISEGLFSDEKIKRKDAISKLIRYFMETISIIEKPEFKHPLLSYQAEIMSCRKKELNKLKNFLRESVIKTPEVQQLEYKGQKIVLEMFQILESNPEKFLPKKTLIKYNQSTNKNRVISDYISGMTDVYAIKMYHRLFSPDIGSIFDRL